MNKYIITWLDKQEEYKAENMLEVEIYANQYVTQDYYWLNITYISEVQE